MLDGKKIKVMRKALGLSLQELGNLTGLSKQTMCNLENEKLKNDPSTCRVVELLFMVIVKDIGEEKFKQLVNIQEQIESLEEQKEQYLKDIKTSVWGL